MKELFLTLMLVVVLAIAGGPSVLAEAPQQIDSAVSHSIINPCNGNTVRFDGTLHHTIRKTADPRGAQLTIGSNVQDVSGLDAEGMQYRMAQGTDFTIPYPTGQHQVTVSEDAPVLSDGEASDFLLHLTLQISIEPDGKTAATIGKVSGDCRNVTATTASGKTPATD